MPKPTKKKPFCEASPEHCFWVHQGPVLKDLRGLNDALRGMSDDIFKYHVNNEKNDFAKWTEDILHQKELAAQMRRLKTKSGIQKAVDAFLKGK